MNQSTPTTPQRRTSRWRNGLLGIAAALFMAPAAFAQCGVGESELSLTTSGGSYASEKWVNITTGANGTGTVIWAQGNGTYGNGAGLVTGVTFCVTNGSTYYINCYDTYADGWDGTVYSITAGPTVVANNGGVSPDDGTDTDASYLWNNPPPSTVELESSEAFSYTPPACPPPSSLGVTALNASGADLGWTESGTATAWDLEIGAGGFSPTGTPTHNDVGANPYTWAGGSANMPYDFYVRADCGMDNVDVSGWSGPYSFFTGYCTPAPTSVDNEGIVRVVFSSVDNNTVATSPEAGNYADFSAMVGDIAQSTTVNVDITYQTGYTYETEIWIDWNDDLDFNDVGENVYSGVSTSSNPTTLNASFAVGTNPLGNHRMRIGGGDNAITQCYTGTYASFEDYTVNVIAPPSCLPPSALTATSITAAGADLGWTENGTATAWDIEIGATPFSPTGTPTFNDVGANPYTWNGGAAVTEYAFYVRADCGMDDVDVSSWSGPYTFTTPCATEVPDYTENFGTYVPNCWEEATGPITGPTAFGSSGWKNDGFGNVGSTGSAAVEIYFTGGQEWLLTPLFDLSAGGYELNFDVALTAWASTSSDVIEADDAVYLMQSTDGGTTWTTINTWNAGNSPSNTGDNTTINISAVTSATTQFGFFMSEGATSGGDKDFFVDNFQVRTPPTCPAPSALSAINVTALGADLGWTENGTATAWDIEIGANGFTPTGTPTFNDVGANPYTWNGGAAVTEYAFYVRADCNMDDIDVSTWTGPYTFITPCAVEVPDYTEDFTTYVPACWEEATGPITGPTAFGSSGWSSGSFGYVGSASAKVEIYSTGGQEWLLTPLFDLSAGGYELNFDVALTAWLSSSADVIEADDAVYLMQSTDGGTTWTTINTWNAGNSPSNTGDNTTIDISAVTSATTQFGFFMLEGGTSGGDKDFYVDNFQVRTPPACPDVSGLAVMNLSLTNVDISWNAAAGATNYLWEIQDSPNAQGTPGPIASGSGAGTSAAAAGTYVDGNDYILYVNSVCGGPAGNYQSHAFTLNIPPANDDCAGAYGLTVNPDYACGATTAGTVENATASPESAAACFGTENDDVWFSFVATNSTHRIQLLNIVGSETDMYHSVWEGGCGSLTLLAGSCSDANTSNPTGMTPGNTYFVRVYNYYSGAENTTFDVCVGTPPPPPANDLCANAIMVGANSVTPGTTVNGTTSGNPGTCTTSLSSAPGVWYSVQGIGGMMTADVCGASFDTKIGIFTGTCGSLTCLQGNDDFCGTASSTTWVGYIGTTYYIYVTGYLTYTGTFNLTLSSVPGVSAVVAITTDSDPGQLSWEFTDSGNSVIATGGPTVANGLDQKTVLLSATPVVDCYGFRLMDSFGDGIVGGNWQIRTTGGKVLLGDDFASGANSPSATPANPTYGTTHSFCLPEGPANIAPTECGIMNNTLLNKVYCNKVIGASLYQFEFSNPDAGYIRRIARNRNYIIFNEMLSVPLTPGVKYFARVRTDRDGPLASAHFGAGCEMGLGLAQVVPCTELIHAPAYGHSCDETRTFNTSANNSFIYAKPVVGGTEYQFRLINTSEGYDHTFIRSTYILMLKWNSNVAPLLVDGNTYNVEINVKVNGLYSGFCASDCDITIANGGERPEASMTQANGSATLWPNPVRDGQVNLNIEGIRDADQQITVDIQDIYGKQVFAKEYGNSGDRFNTILNLSSDIASGVYMVNITVNGKRTVQRLSIIR